MSGLNLSMALERSEVLVGESLIAKVKLQNLGTSPLQVDCSLDMTGFITSPRYSFVVRSTKGELVGTLAFKRADQARNPDDSFPSEPPMTMPLTAGASKEDACDLASLQVTPLPPARYQVSVRYESSQGPIESSPVSLSVLPIRPTALAAVEGTTKTGSGQAVVHAPASGPAVVLQREGRYEVPSDGVWFRRAELAAPARSPAVAVAVELAMSRHYRWMAWKEGDAARAGLGESSGGWTVIPSVTPLGIESAQLHPIGWQPTRESALFVALGQEAGGQVALAELACTLKSATVHKARLALSAMPASWAARYRTEGNGAKLDVVTAQPVGGTVRIVRQSVPVGGGAAEKPVTLADFGGKLAALALAPVAEPGADSVDVLLGPGADGSTMTLQRLALDGGKVLGTWAFPPSANTPAKPSAWAMASKPLAEPVLLARVGDQLLVRHAGQGKQWVVVAEHAAGAEHLRLEVAEPGTLWAFWTDPAKGVQVVKVP